MYLSGVAPAGFPLHDILATTTTIANAPLGRSNQHATESLSFQVSVYPVLKRVRTERLGQVN